MSEENRSYDEIQSKTFLLEDNEGVNDMLSALNTGRAALDKKKKEIEQAKRMKMIAFAVAGSVIALFIIFLILK
jgi:hypothetical protein